MQFEDMFTFLKMLTTAPILKISVAHSPYPSHFPWVFQFKNAFNSKASIKPEVNPSPWHNCEPNSKFSDLEGSASHQLASLCFQFLSFFISCILYFRSSALNLPRWISLQELIFHFSFLGFIGEISGTNYTYRLSLKENILCIRLHFLVFLYSLCFAYVRDYTFPSILLGTIRASVHLFLICCIQRPFSLRSSVYITNVT